MANFKRFSERVRANFSPEEAAAYEALSERYELGAQIRAARVAAGLTQQELAELSDVPQSELSRIERAVVEPSFARTARIMRATGGDAVVVPPSRMAAAGQD